MRNLAGMSTGDGLNAQWQFPDTEGKATPAILKRSNAMRSKSGDTRMSTP